MPYNKIEDFLKGDPANYNFEFECDVEEYIQLPTLDRYLTYKATGLKADSAYDSGNQFITKTNKNEEYKKLADCDGSGKIGNVKLIHDIYLKLWKWEKEKGRSTFGYIQSDDFKCQFGGDTMNSMQTILDDIVKNIVDKKENVHLLNKKIGKNVSIRYMLGLYGDDECKQDLINKIDSIEYMSEYANYYHTIGNFVLVPRGFNGWRGLNKKDYWHLSLEILKERGWKDNFNFEGNTIGDYYRYINYFFLWDYVDLFGNYVDLLQSNNDNKKYFLKTVIKFIKRRSIFIVTMLRLQLILGEVAYIELRNHLFLKNDGVYDDYDEVILKIKNHFKGDKQEEIIQLLDNAQKDIEEYQR